MQKTTKCLKKLRNYSGSWIFIRSLLCLCGCVCGFNFIVKGWWRFPVGLCSACNVQAWSEGCGSWAWKVGAHFISRFLFAFTIGCKSFNSMERKCRKPINRTQPRSPISSQVEKLFSAKSYTTYVVMNKQKSEEAQTASISARLDGVL